MKYPNVRKIKLRGFIENYSALLEFGDDTTERAFGIKQIELEAHGIRMTREPARVILEPRDFLAFVVNVDNGIMHVAIDVLAKYRLT